MNKPNILVVEDDVDIAHIFKKILENANYKVDVVYNGELALDHLVSNKPDLILTDFHLPGITGLELLKSLKSNEATKHIFVVMISGLAKSPSDKSTGLEVGADGYLVKPIEARELIAHVDSFLRHKSTLDELRSTKIKYQNLINELVDNHAIISKSGDKLSIEQLLKNHEILSP